jgi:hypothetical protein
MISSTSFYPPPFWLVFTGSHITDEEIKLSEDKFAESLHLAQMGMFNLLENDVSCTAALHCFFAPLICLVMIQRFQDNKILDIFSLYKKFGFQSPIEMLIRIILKFPMYEVHVYNIFLLEKFIL